ncbi:hypothetical protein REPUB_Repub03eG0135100 [Reevesia pubescens]
MLEWCVVGTMRDYYESRMIMENFRISGVFDIIVKNISGKQFLIEFEDEEMRNNIKLLNCFWLKE